MKTFILIIGILCMSVAGYCQTTIYMENKDILQCTNYKESKDKVTCDGKDILKQDIFYFEKKGKYFVFNYKTGKLIKVKPIEDLSSSQGQGLLYAYKYFNAKIDINSIKLIDNTLIADDNFLNSYKKYCKKFKSSSTATGIVLGTLVTISLLLSITLLIGTLSAL